jgi:tripartite-type tricarboxylate transporter receptor subunit TctC
MRYTLSLLVMAAGAMHLAPSTIHAQGYPNKAIRMIVPFPPGGGVDFVGRVVGQKLSERLGQQVAIDNRAGANGIVGLQALMTAAPDGYTIAAVSAGPLAINPHLYAKLPYNTLRDFTPIANMINFPLMLVAHPSLPVKNVKELVALAKARPNEITYSHPGVGNTGHIAGELLNAVGNVKTQGIPYKGTAPSVIAVLSGEAHLTYSSIPTALPHIRAGKLRALGVGNAKRMPSLPEFPTVAESGLPGYEAYAWGGMLGPAKMPNDIVQRLAKEIIAAVNSKDVTDRMLNEGTVPTPSTPEEFTAYITSELKKWGDVIKAANIKVE